MTLQPPIFYNGLDVNGQVITSHGTPVNPTDVINKAYADALIALGNQWHAAVRVAATSNVTITAPGTAIDTVTLSAGDRVLLTGQTTASQNGPWVFTASGTAMTRPTDWPAAGLRTNVAAFFPVDEGTHNGSTDSGPIWYLTTDGAITIDTTSTAWSYLTSGVTYTALSTGGLLLSAGAFSVKLPGSSGLVEDATGLYATKASMQAIGITAKYAVDSPSLTAGTPATITHSLGTTDVQVLCYRKSDGMYLPPGALGETQLTSNTISIQSATSQTAAAFRIIVIG